jgi:uncharacterized protein (TIGR02118 family)
MPVSLFALYRRPKGGDEELATFRHRYSSEHMPLVRATPGLRSLVVHRVTHAFQESDLVMIAEMIFDSRADLDAGLESEPMRQAGRNLREIATGGFTLVVVEPEPEALYAHDSSLVGLYEAGASDTGGSREPLPDNRATQPGTGPESGGDTSTPRDTDRR